MADVAQLSNRAHGGFLPLPPRCIDLVIALLLEHGADVTASNFANQTAAHVANDGVRAQLLSAVTRTSFPELSMMQGDLERVKYLQSIGHGHYLHNRNGQGLTPAMLLLRDVDLFDNLQTTGSDYQTVAVLQELLRHHVDTDLLDTITNVSDMTSPLRRQLMDALETPETDAHDDASCDLCLNTKPPLCVAPPAIQNQSSEEAVFVFFQLLQNYNSQHAPTVCKIILEDVNFCNTKHDLRLDVALFLEDGKDLVADSLQGGVQV
ncbi:hypothetical protein GDO81_018759 [Engystomops pustulosus]|uniref:Uncharacterized protein n=1 Tax=Engystomops pustulosus TaxID=76066 RepID=A0AAV6Z2T0_ENGPU|nr:hypothetical protein GDO81_018759 [Engystomops pustulosus]